LPKGSPPPNLSVTSVSASQLEFLEGHLKKNYKGKKKENQLLLQRAWDSLTLNRDRTMQVVDQVHLVASSDADRDFVKKQRESIVATMAVVNQAKIKSLKDSLAVIDAANKAVALHDQESMKFLLGAGMAGRDLDHEEQIVRAKALARVEWTSIMAQFDAKLKVVKDKLEAETGVPNMSLGISAEFNANMKVFLSMIDGVPQRGSLANADVAQKALDAIIAKMRELLSGDPAQTVAGGFEAQINAVDDSDLLAFFAESTQRKTTFNGQMVSLKGQLDILDRWDTPTYPAFAAKSAEMTKIAEGVFKPFKQLVDGETDALGETEQNLIIDARREIISAQRAVASARNAFEEPKEELEAQFKLLEARMVAVRKTVDKAQRAPIEAYLAALGNAITGLGGCNVDALKPAQTMMIEATKLVESAEDIQNINKAIKDVLVEAAKVAVQFKDKVNPLADESADVIAEIQELNKTYKTISISDAQKQAQALKDRADTEKTRNDLLIMRRSEVAARIENTEKMLSQFNEKFREMLAHAGKPEQDYKGSFRTELDTCISWNATKTNPDFYSPIMSKLATLSGEIIAKMAEVREFIAIDFAEQANAVALAGTKYGSDKLALETKLDAETDPQKQRALITELADLKDAFEADNAGMGVLREFEKEMGDAEAKVRLAETAKENYLAAAKVFLSAIGTEIKDKALVLYAYRDEVQPQIDRIQTTYDSVKADKPGADGAIGSSELKFVEKFLDGVRARGLKTDKDDLGNIGVEWSAEVTKLSDAAKALNEAIIAFENMHVDQDHSTSDKVDSILTALISRVDTREFANAGKQMASAADRQAIKAARELALSEVRRCRAVMLDDKVFQKCVMNPFKVVLGSTAANRLDGIELNVLRGV